LDTGGVRGQGAGFGLGVTVWQYVLTQFDALILYLKLTFWPHPLVLDYGCGYIRSPAEVVPQIVLISILGLGTLLAMWRWPVIGFIGAWFFIIISPSSSVVPLAGQTMAEHRMYLPLAAVIVLVLGTAYRFAGRGSFIAAVVLVPVLMTVTFARNRDYNDV